MGAINKIDKVTNKTVYFVFIAIKIYNNLTKYYFYKYRYYNNTKNGKTSQVNRDYVIGVLFRCIAQTSVCDRKHKGGSKNYEIVIPAFASMRSTCRNPLFMRLRRFLHSQE